MRRALRSAVLAAVASVVTLAAAADPAAIPPEASAGRSASQGRVVAFGDVHGAHDALVATLRQAGIIDAELRWTGGTATLVSVGDLVDRGPASRKVLDLLMRLEGEARQAGGAVRVVLGNHEVMTLLGELRDASAGEFAEFAVDETTVERRTAEQRFVARRVAAGASGAAASGEFAARFPPGWFARRRAFAPDGRYGAWLLQRPVAIVVDRTAFVHGGFSRAVVERDLTELNRTFHAGLIAQLADIATLEHAGWLDPLEPGERRAETLAARLPPVPIAEAAPPPSAALAVDPREMIAERVVRFDLDPLYRLYGPTWYRGAALCHAATERDVIEAARRRLGVERIVVGHTPTNGARIRSRFDGGAVFIDTGMLHAVYGGSGSVLEITAAGLVAIYQDGSRTPVEPDPRAVALGVAGGDAALERALGGWSVLDDAPVVDDAAVASERRAVLLGSGDVRLAAWFYPDRAPGGRHTREVAAYRLDRALGLGLVPTTVERKIGEIAGALQWRPPGAITATDAQRSPPTGTQWCDMPAQVGLMYVWDALTLNEGRTLDSIAYTDEDWLLISSDHRRAFGERVAMPGHLVGRPLTVGPELCRRLAGLGAKTLRRAVGRALSGKEQTALLRRRDQIVRDAQCAR